MEHPHFDREAMLAMWGRIDSGAFIFNRINRLTPRLTYLLAMLMLVAIGAADFITDIELTFSPFYALPCLLVDWRIGRLPALVYGLFASFVQWLIGTVGGHPFSQDYYFYIDLLLNLVFYGALIWLVAKLRIALEMERVLSRVDFLTKLPNHLVFDEVFTREYYRCLRYGHPLTVVFVSCDNFLLFVREKGFSTGDLLLGAVATTMQHSLRVSDFVARTAHYEFAAILPETAAEHGKKKLKKLHRQLNELALMRGWSATISVASVVFEQLPTSATDALAEAKELLMHATQFREARFLHKVWTNTGAGMATSLPQKLNVSEDTSVPIE